MKDIIRAQLRQARRTTMLYIIFFLLAGSCAVGLLNATVDGASASAVTAGDGKLIAAFSLMFLGTAASWICGADLEDKTVNHEMTSGRLRRDVYLGRVIPAMAVAVTGTLVLIFMVFGITTALVGWGHEIPLSNALLRFALLVFPLLRLGAFSAAVTFVTKNRVTGFMVCLYAAMFSLPADALPFEWLRDLLGNYLLLSPLTFGKLCTFDSWYVYGCADLKMHYIYYPELSGSLIAGIVIVSLIMTAVYLLLGYHFFHTDDLK